MSIENKLPLYIGITDFENATQVWEMLSIVPIEHRRSLMVGVMTSYKTLNGLPTKWAKVWPPKEDLAYIFVDHPKALNTLHWADYEGKTTKHDLHVAVKFCGENLRAIQLDMIWPDPAFCLYLEHECGIPVVLQIGGDAFEEVDNDVSALLRRLAGYNGTISGVLLDKSMGKGKGLNADFLRPFIKGISREYPDLHIAVAGGLGPDSLHLVRPLMNEFSDLSIDAQGQLRDSGNALDPINWLRAGNYLFEAISMFP